MPNLHRKHYIYTRHIYEKPRNVEGAFLRINEQQDEREFRGLPTFGHTETGSEVLDGWGSWGRGK